MTSKGNSVCCLCSSDPALAGKSIGTILERWEFLPFCSLMPATFGRTGRVMQCNYNKRPDTNLVFWDNTVVVWDKVPNANFKDSKPLNFSLGIIPYMQP